MILNLLKYLILKLMILLTMRLERGYTVLAQEANYEESAVPAYTLPDPLVCADGTRVQFVRDWEGKRRPELLALPEETLLQMKTDPDFSEYDVFIDDILRDKPVHDGENVVVPLG